ncbi:hypothetical protein KKE60_04240 [Patescibacteria group bacterium]|nr:hypothetical protein [Patescibacteria group bacterium]
MGTIITSLTVTQTVAVANGAALQATQDWVKANIIDKLPENVNIVISYQVVP